nr:DNA cytosine methyltransferase [Brucella anthropi]
MRYGSVCSGIDAASAAWESLGWEPAFFSEIEPFPCHVLHHRYASNRPLFMPDPDESGLSAKEKAQRRASVRSVNALPLRTNGAPNMGDMTQFEKWPDHAIDLLIGGTPCQDFSIAGLRAGLDGDRGNLTLVYAAIARRYRPRWLVWENVPGVFSSNRGRDFASLLGLLSGRRVEVPAGGWKSAGIVEGYSCAYGLAWRVLDSQFVRVDGFERAVPQRRRRVFVVGYLGDWRRAAAVLFERESLSGNPAPRRETGKGAASTITASTGGCSGKDGLDGRLIASTGDVAHCLNAGGMGRQDYETETMVAHPLLAKGNSSHDETLETYVTQPYTLAIRGRGESHDLEYRQDGTANALLTPNGGRAGVGVGAVCAPIAFDTTQITSKSNGSNPKEGDPCHPLAAGAHPPSIAWSIMPQNSGKDYKARQVDVAQPLMAGGPVGGNQGGDYIQQQWAVRRLTPIECARLQGFHDDHCRIPWRGKSAEECPDGPQYKGYGNSMSVGVIRWLGRRIEMVEAVL